MAVAAVALNDELLVGTILQRAIDFDRGGHGAAVAAPVVDLAVLETGGAGFRAREAGGDVLSADLVAVKPRPEMSMLIDPKTKMDP